MHYTQEVAQDADYERPENKLPPEWPVQGAIEFEDVEMSYRPELPTVLKGLTMTVQGGEKVGIVGRSVFCLYVQETVSLNIIFPERVLGNRLS